MITYHLKINGQDPRVLFSDMEFVAGDVGAYRLVFSFFDENAPLPLADKILSVKTLRADGVVLSDSGEITGDTAVYIPKNDCFCVPGMITFEIALMDGAKNYITTKIIHATVLEGVGEPREVAEDNVSVYVSLLAQTKAQLDAANQACNTAKALLSETQNSLTEKADALFITTEPAPTHTLTDTAEGTVLSLSVLGNTTQNGIPTPQNPIDFVSVENPTITVGDQTVTIPYTLRGVGDAKDEIVVDSVAKTVKHIERIKEYVFDDTVIRGIQALHDRGKGVYAATFSKQPLGIEMGYYSPKAYMRSYRPFSWDLPSENNTFLITYQVHTIGIMDSRFTSTAVVKELLMGEKLVLRPTSTYEVVTDITDTECGQALLALKTAYPVTSITCGTDCSLTYRADTTNAYKHVKNELDTLKQAIITMGGDINV